jgi:hypothetical protein
VLLRQDERNAHLFAVKPPAMGEEEKLILEHEGQAALSEMGELIPDPDDAISQAEPDEPPAHSPAVSILIDGQWQEFPSASAAEKASYADFKAASHREAQNFRITDDDLGAGGAKAKFQANLNVIQLLKHLEAEGLQASPEQQQVLSRYVGWGGLPDAFDASKPSWASEYQALKAAFTPEEYTTARASTLNAHYTSPTVIRAIYEAVGNMGFQTGNILEPSMGIGNFFGMLPKNMRGSRLYGVELDSITGRIAKQLYPNANITIAGFETTDRRDFFDLAVGNVPFGQYKVNDPAYNKLGFNISDLKNRVAAAFLQRFRDTELYPVGIGAEPQQAETPHFHFRRNEGISYSYIRMHCLLLLCQIENYHYYSQFSCLIQDFS